MRINDINSKIDNTQQNNKCWLRDGNETMNHIISECSELKKSNTNVGKTM